MPVEDEEQKEHGHKLGPNIHDISSMFYTQYHALCTHQKQCDISLNFTPQRCLLQRCVRLQNPKFHHLREKVFQQYPIYLIRDFNMAFLFKESYWSTLEALTVIKSLFKSTSFSTMFSRMKYPVSQATNASVCIQDWVSERVYPGSVVCLQGTHTHQDDPMAGYGHTKWPTSHT